ncbi:MAG: PAS domain S-box protein [Desulfobacterales bacterium]
MTPIQPTYDELKTFFELVPDMICIAGVDGYFVYLNEAWERALSYSRDELFAKPFFEFIHPEDHPNTSLQFNRLKSGMPVEKFENRYQCKDGIYKWLEWRCVTAVNGYLYGIAKDITHRKQAEHAFKKHEAILENTERLTKVGGWEWDLENETMIWTEELYRIHDLEPGDLTSGSAEHKERSLECYAPTDRPIIENAFKRCCEYGEPYDLEFPFTTGKGRRLWIRTIGRPVVQNNRITHVIGNLMDISDRKRVEDLLKNSENRFRAIFENATVGMALVSLDGRILMANQVFSRFLGYSPEECVNIHFSEVTYPEDLDVDSGLYNELVEGKRDAYLLDKRYVRKDGRIFWGRLGVSLIKEIDGRPKFAVGTCEDITDRKLAEEELKKAKEECEIQVRERTAELNQRATLLAKLSSELTLAEQRERDRIARMLHDELQQLMVGAKIRQETLIPHVHADIVPAFERVLDLVNQSIELSRSLSSRLSPPVLRSGNFSAALKWLAQWVFENHGLEVDLEIEDEVILDRREVTVLLFQSVRELLLNVRKHADVTSASVIMDHHNGNLSICVKDGGLGFDTENARKAGSEQKFGLFSIEERLSHLGGHIKIKSSLNKGTAISLIIPIEKKQETIKKQKSLIQKIRQKITVPETIRLILADDHAVMREGLSKMLDLYADIEVIGEASEGQAAINLTRELVPDVILMDVNMPKMTGVEATRIIHSEFPQIRIIGLSMYEEDEKAAEMIDAGASAYRSKTGSTDRLLASIRGE